MWEIASYGVRPYHNMETTTSMMWESMISYLKAGNTLHQPHNCPDHFYKIMKSCWDLDPENRPDAEDLVKQLSLKDTTISQDDGSDDVYIDTPTHQTTTPIDTSPCN
jgi:hypothetical protein